jgi:hypothetical protein
LADTSRRERFEKIASKRVANILKGLDSLEKCSNKNNYDYNSADIKKMEKALREKVNDVLKSFNKELDKGKNNEFKF